MDIYGYKVDDYRYYSEVYCSNHTNTENAIMCHAQNCKVQIEPTVSESEGYRFPDVLIETEEGSIVFEVKASKTDVFSGYGVNFRGSIANCFVVPLQAGKKIEDAYEVVAKCVEWISERKRFDIGVLGVAYSKKIQGEQKLMFWEFVPPTTKGGFKLKELFDSKTVYYENSSEVSECE